MIFRVTLKDPDALYDAIRESVDDSLHADGSTLGSPDILKLIKEERVNDIEELCQLWFSWGEYLTVEIDTEKKTCVVLPQ